MIFNTWEEAEEAFDSDKERERVERWVEDCGHEVHEEEHTMKEWAELKKEANRLVN